MMGRIRTIKPEFPTSQTMRRVSRDARLFFVYLWTIVDDAGRAPADPQLLASLLLPFDDDRREVAEASLNALEGAGCIRRYVAEGNFYLDIPNWLKHQRIEKPSPSKIPAFDDYSPNIPGSLGEGSPTIPGGKGKERKGKGRDQEKTGKEETINNLTLDRSSAPPSAPLTNSSRPSGAPKPYGGRQGMSPDLGDDYRSPPRKTDEPPLTSDRSDLTALHAKGRK